MQDIYSDSASEERFADTVTIRVSAAMRRQLERTAAAQERSVASVVRRALREVVGDLEPRVSTGVLTPPLSAPLGAPPTD